ncbi:MAG TPA: PAS domain S-box protein, partial [Candidatus Nanoarchaeia archaeon]|nr:PAS domain S-box protein [Candidatus Nanoarchaeia archaeon]
MYGLKSKDTTDLMHILHVDDDGHFLEVIKEILCLENNFKIDCVNSIDEALTEIQKQTYDAIVSDYEMPHKSGLDFLKYLRDRGNDIPFIFLTGKGREEVVVKALNLGADQFIDKHGSIETVCCELADAIKKTVDRRYSRLQYVNSESNYRSLVENSLQGITVTTINPIRLVFANEAMKQLLGYSPQELTSLSADGIQSLIHPKDRKVFFNRLESRFKGEPAETCLEFRAVRKDGSIIWLSGFSNMVEYDGQWVLLGMFLNITEKKKNEELLQENEERYRQIANFLPVLIFETDLSGQIIFANKIAREVGGYSEEELEKGLHFSQVLSQDGQDRAFKDFEHLLSGGKPIIVEFTFVRKNGSTFPALITVAPIFHQNKITGVRGLVLDIT